jgi:hypothetical protein
MTILKSTEIVASQKSKLPFYLYAYCLRIEDLLSVAQRMSGLSREELCSNSKRRGTVAVKEAAIVPRRRGGMRSRETGSGAGAGPVTSHKTILITGGAETSMASSPPQNSYEFIAISYPS